MFSHSPSLPLHYDLGLDRIKSSLGRIKVQLIHGLLQPPGRTFNLSWVEDYFGNFFSFLSLQLHPILSMFMISTS